jgi:hypothetical protein
MKALRVHLNGKKICAAARFGDWPLIVTIELENPAYGKDTLSVHGRSDNDLGVWANSELNLGDEIVVKVVETDEIDEPLHHIPALPESSGPREMGLEWS